MTSNLYAQSRVEVLRQISAAQQNDRLHRIFHRPATTMMNVGYQPVIVVLPEGTNFGVNAIVSADRRHIRVGVCPMFSGITEVNTFNVYTGEGRRIR